MVTSFAHDVPLIETIPAMHNGSEEVQGRSLAYKYQAQQGEMEKKKNQNRGAHREKKKKGNTGHQNRTKEIIQRKKKETGMREGAYRKKKNEHKGEPSFFPPLFLLKETEEATSGEPEERERERDLERRGLETEGEGNNIGGRKQRPEVLHRVSASLHPCKPFFLLLFSLIHLNEEHCTVRR